MWPKDDYQEQMLGYLDEVQTEIEQLALSHLQQHDLTTLYIDLDMTSKRLWRLIGASYEEWEGCRYSLEASCDVLLRAFYRLPRTDSLTLSAFAITEQHEMSVE